MKKTTLTILLAILTIQISLAQQTGTIRGTLLDQATNDPIPGAVIEVTPARDTTNKKHYTSVYAGAVNIPQMAYGDYKLKITFIGYEDYLADVKVNKQTVNLGQIPMKLKAQEIGLVIAEGQAMRTSQKGDTLTYNAGAFKVTRDADAEALLSKMPGITVIDGEVEAQGETVKKIFVDGKEFFGQDVNATIKNLPAEMIDRIEVYNKLSDQAEFSGVDDGEGFKAINIVTNVRSAQFGKIYGGYAFDDMYIGGANVNFFSGEHRFSIMGMANNLNQQNFSMEDILGAVSGGSGGGGGRGGRGMSSRGGGFMRGGAGNFMVRQQDGISTVQSFALNYQGKWWKKVDVTGSYFFTNSENDNHSTTERQYIDDRDWIYTSKSSSNTRNTEHRFNARVDYKINDNHNLMMRPSVSFQNYKSERSDTSTTMDLATGIEQLVSGLKNESNNKNWGYNLSNMLIYRVRLGKPGRTLTTEIGGSLGNNDRDNYSLNIRRNLNPKDSVTIQRSENDTRNYSINGSLMYTEPITEHSQITAQYRYNYRYSDADKRTDLYNETLDMFEPSDDFSSVYNSGYTTHRVGPGYNYRKNRNNLIINGYYQRSTLNGDQEFPTASKVDKQFDDFVYFARFEQTFNPATTLRIFARSSTNNPSISQLQDVIDMSNTQFVTAGNPDLQPAYEHNIFGNFIRSNVTKGTTFMVMGNFAAQSDYIAEDVNVSTASNPVVLGNGETLETGAQLTEYSNMNGYWQLRGRMSYGFPVKFLKSNLNIDLGGQLLKTPSRINGQKNLLTGQYYNAGLVLGSNISENIDFTITYNGGYNIASNSIRKDYNNEYLIQYVALRFKWVAWAGFTLSGNGSYTQNKGITDDYNDEYFLLNLALGKKVFRNQRGEFTIGVNDVFNQKTSFRRNVTTEYIENVKSNTLGRYCILQFVYNLRSYGKRTASSSFSGNPDSLGPRPGGGRPPMGPPPGGPF